MYIKLALVKEMMTISEFRWGCVHIRRSGYWTPSFNHMYTALKEPSTSKNIIRHLYGANLQALIVVAIIIRKSAARRLWRSVRFKNGKERNSE